MLITSQDAWHCCYDDEHAQKIVLKYNGKPVESLWVDLSRYWWKIGFDVSKKQVLTLFGVSPSTVSKLKAAFHIMGIVRHVAQWASEGHIMKTSGDCAPRPVHLTWQEKKKKNQCVEMQLVSVPDSERILQTPTLQLTGGFSCFILASQQRGGTYCLKDRA